MGLPQPLDHNISTFHRIFRNNGFIVGYSDIYGQPLWASYLIRDISKKRDKRPDRFSSDWRALHWITHDDYTGSGYDRGHLVPNYAMSKIYGRDAQLDSFLLTNIAPQKPDLNRKVWQRLEVAAVDVFGAKYGELWVTVGPIFGSKITRLDNQKIAIPEAFFMIFATNEPHPKMLAFIVPQSVKGDEKLAKFVVSVDKVEHLSGFDFFHKLPQPMQENIESQIVLDGWEIP